MKKILSCVALSAVLLSGCTFKAKTGVIKVNDNYITKTQIDKVIDKEISNSPFASIGGTKNFLKSDDNVMYVIYKQKAIKEAIVRSLLEAEIAKRGIKVTDDDVKAETKSIIDKVGSKEALAEMLKSRGISNSEFIEDVKTQVKIRKLVDSIEKVNVTDAEAKKFYDSNISQFKHDEQVRASHIFVSANTLQIIQTLKAKNKNITPEELNTKVEENLKAQKVKAEAVLKQVNARPDGFEEIAQKESDDKVSAARGGDLGYFSKGAMVPEFSKAAFEMKPDTISGLIQTPYGYHIIKVTDRVEAGTTPFNKVSDEIKFYLKTQKQMSVLKNLSDSLMKSANIEYLDDEYNPEKTAKKYSESVKKMESSMNAEEKK